MDVWFLIVFYYYCAAMPNYVVPFPSYDVCKAAQHGIDEFGGPIHHLCVSSLDPPIKRNPCPDDYESGYYH